MIIKLTTQWLAIRINSICRSQYRHTYPCAIYILLYWILMENNGDFPTIYVHSNCTAPCAHNLLSQIIHTLNTITFTFYGKWTWLSVVVVVSLLENEMQVHKYRLTGREFFISRKKKSSQKINCCHWHWQCAVRKLKMHSLLRCTLNRAMGIEFEMYYYYL